MFIDVHDPMYHDIYADMVGFCSRCGEPAGLLMPAGDDGEEICEVCVDELHPLPDVEMPEWDGEDFIFRVEDENV